MVPALLRHKKKNCHPLYVMSPERVVTAQVSERLNLANNFS
jgi:hypothetical protein